MKQLIKNKIVMALDFEEFDQPMGYDEEYEDAVEM